MYIVNFFLHFKTKMYKKIHIVFKLPHLYTVTCFYVYREPEKTPQHD